MAPTRRRLVTVLDITAAGPGPDDGTPPVVVTLPGGVPGEEYWLALLTSIRVFDDIQLLDYESGLTMPDIVWPLCPDREGEQVAFRYVLGTDPQIRWQRL